MAELTTAWLEQHCRFLFESACGRCSTIEEWTRLAEHLGQTARWGIPALDDDGGMDGSEAVDA